MQPNSELTMQIDPAEAVVARSATDGLALIPVSVTALGTPARPIEQLMALQAALARVVDLLAAPRHIRPRLALPTWLRAHSH